jgi:hypothetical protein
MQAVYKGTEDDFENSSLDHLVKYLEYVTGGISALLLWAD